MDSEDVLHISLVPQTTHVRFCIRYYYYYPTFSILHSMYIYIYICDRMHDKNRMESDARPCIMGICCVLMRSCAYFLMSRLHNGRDPGSFVYDNNFPFNPWGGGSWVVLVPQPASTKIKEKPSQPYKVITVYTLNILVKWLVVCLNVGCSPAVKTAQV